MTTTKTTTKVGDRIPFSAAAKLFPPMSADEFAGLVSDIKEHGLRRPIVTYKGEILEGCNRYNACLELGIKPKLEEWKGKGSPTEYALSENLHRRHLSAAQRAAIATEALPLLEAEAKTRAAKPAKGGKARAPEKAAKKRGAAGRSREHAAKAAGVAPSSVARAKAIKTKAPELHRLVQAGKLSLREAEERAKLKVEPKVEAKVEAAVAALQGRWKPLQRAIQALVKAAEEAQVVDRNGKAGDVLPLVKAGRGCVRDPAVFAVTTSLALRALTQLEPHVVAVMGAKSAK